MSKRRYATVNCKQVDWSAMDEDQQAVLRFRFRDWIAGGAVGCATLAKDSCRPIPGAQLAPGIGYYLPLLSRTRKRTKLIRQRKGWTMTRAQYSDVIDEGYGGIPRVPCFPRSRFAGAGPRAGEALVRAQI